MGYWWCLEHKAVEEGIGCGSTTRLGPYDDAQRAATVLERVHKREGEQVEKDRQIEKKWGSRKGWF